MLTQLLESLLINVFNGARQGASRPDSRRRTATLAPAGHVVLGHTIPSLPGGASESVSLSPEERRRHLYVLGATGCGKTNCLLRLIESDIESRRSFCVIDLRGDLVERILLRLARHEDPETLGERLLLVDLRDERHVVGFNPLSGGGDAYSRAFHVLSVLRQQSESWGVQLEETLRNCLLALAETGWSLLEIDTLLGSPAFRESVLSGVSDSYVRSFFGRYGQLSEEKQMAWRLPVLNKVTPLLAIPQLRLMFGQRQSFSFQQLLDGEPGRIILVSLAVDRLHQAAYLVGGLLVSAFQTAIMARTDQPESRRVPVHLYLDEFETMASDRFEAIVAEGRRFGLGLCLSHQNLSQVPTRLRHVLRNNVHTQLFFQTGALDAGELVNEIPTEEPKEAVRTALLTQGVGEAFLIRRSQPSARVRIIHSPDPRPDPAAVQAIREASFRTYARPRTEVEREFREREQQFESLPGQGSGGETGEKPTYEIRHSKPAGKFRPKRP